MQHYININQRAIVEAGLSGIKLNGWAVFDLFRNAISSGWAHKIVEDGIAYAWVSDEKILDELPLLDVSRRQLQRIVSDLVDAGLLVRNKGNKSKRRQYIGMGEKADLLTTTTTKMSMSQDSLSQKRPSHIDKNDVLTTTEMSMDNITNDQVNHNQVLSAVPADGQPQNVRVKGSPKTRTAEDSMRFYTSQVSLIDSLPPAPDAVAAARRESYKGMVGWFRLGDPVIAPGGMHTTLLRMGDPLSFAQWEDMFTNLGMDRHQIKHYLIRMHNWTERHKNKSIYNTIAKWWEDDGKSGKRPAKGGTKSAPQSQGLTVPERVRQ